MTPHRLITTTADFSRRLASAWVSRRTSALLEFDEHVALIVKNAQGTLFLMRDAFGFTPVFFERSGDGIWRASCDVRALLSSPPIPRQSFVDGVLGERMDVPRSSRDMLGSVHSVRPGEVVVLPHRGEATRDAWWTPGRAPNAHHARSHRERFASALVSSCARSAERGTPVVSMSGGLDSCALSGIARRELEAPLRVASIVFPEHPGSDESEAIEAMARHLSMHVDCHDARSEWFTDGISRALNAHHAPSPDPELFPSGVFMPEFWRSALGDDASSSLWVGLGADQLLATLPAHLPQRRCSPRGAFAVVREHLPYIADGISFASHFARMRQSPHAPLPRRLLARAHAALEGASMARLTPGAWRRAHLLTWSWEASMRELRRASLLLGTPIEAPFLDRALWEVASALPAAVTWRKGVLRDAADGERWIPEALAKRPKTVFFDAFVARVIGEDTRIPALLSRDALGRAGYSTAGYAREAWLTWRRENTLRMDRPLWTLRLWRWIAMTLWVDVLDPDH